VKGLTTTLNSFLHDWHNATRGIQEADDRVLFNTMYITGQA